MLGMRFGPPRSMTSAKCKQSENWCYTHKVLQDVSQHYKTKKPMPDELIEKIIKSDSINKVRDFGHM